MKTLKPYIVSALLVFLVYLSVFSQQNSPYCQNLGFELGNFTNWDGYTWRYGTWDTTYNSLPVQGLLNRRQTIITDQSAFDPNTGNALKMIPPGYNYSARLGDGRRSGDQSPRNWHQTLRYNMDVNENNELLILKFALVLQYELEHEPIEEPRFSLTLYDQNGDTIPDCANYSVFATNSRIKGFHNYYPPDGGDLIQWRDWTTVGVDLSAYRGQDITVEFLTADCIRGFHFGYAYLVASCQPRRISMKYCNNDSIARLTAPDGFEKYSWKNSVGTIIDTMQMIEVTNPVEGSTYSCEMLSETDCYVTMHSTINKYSPVINFNAQMLDCFSNSVQFTDLSYSNRGSLLYMWDFGDGNISYEKSPQYTFLTSGMHQVIHTIINPPSVCSDFIIRDVESFSPPLVGIEGDSTYCPGQSVVLQAYGAYDYTWSTGSKADSIEVFPPGGDYWLIGRSSTGCYDSNYTTIIEEPDWEFAKVADTLMCIGDSLLLTVYGANEYLWNTGDTINSIYADIPGIYTVAGKNRRGCEKHNSFTIATVPPPDANFTLSDSTLSGRENSITCNSPANTNVQYFWELGDGSTSTGPTAQHAYQISNGILTYTISLTAIDKYGCTNNSSEIIDVIPFIPNVFTPNGDGINDIFMPGIDLLIIDRNGTKIYEGFNGWDGTRQGQPVDPDTYFYSIFYTNRYNQVQNKKGFVTLLR